MPEERPRAYTVTQSGRAPIGTFVPNGPVTDLDSLHTHHPKRNFSAHLVDGLPAKAENTTTRSYAVLGGEFQEVLDLRVDKYRSLHPDQVLLIKDFILDDTTARDSRRVDVPSPLAGVIGRVDARNGVVDVHETADGPVVARLRHLGPIAVAVGDTVAYGQSLGTQNNIGLGRDAGKHVHIEMDTRYYAQFQHYMLDLVEGRLPVQAAHRTGVEPRPVVDDGVQRVGEAGERVTVLQRALVAAGHRSADGTAIATDGVYRMSMQGAVLRFQEDHGLAPTGDVDVPTWRDALDQVHGRHVLPPPVVDTVQPRLPAARQGLLDRIRERLGALDPLDRSALPECERERVACALLRLAVDNRLATVDHIVLGSSGQADTRLFLVQGRLDDPAQRRAWMPMAEATSTPVEASLAHARSAGTGVGIDPVHVAAHAPAQEMTSRPAI